MYHLTKFMLIGCVCVALGQRPTIAPKNIVDITPIPMENLNPRLTEFRRIDANSDNYVTFTEFLIGDRPYLEAQSRNFHNLDSNADGRVSREEFEAFYKEQDDSRNRIHADGFFKQLTNIFDEPNKSGSPILFSFPPHLFATNENNKNGSTGQ